MQLRLRLSVGAIVAAASFVSCGVPRAAPPRSVPRRLLAVATLANIGQIPKAPPAAAVVQAKRTAPPDQRVTFAFTGDTLTHSPVVDAARRPDGGYDFFPMFARVAPLISWADVAVCHLETPIAPPGQALSTYPSYGVPAEVTNGLASAGYDRCSTASNHTIDRGVAGIDATVNALEAAGLGESGMARAPAEAVPKLFTVNGITIAHLSYAYGLNGIPLPRDEPWRSNIIDPQAIIAAAGDARARGAQIVVVSLHWGTEGLSGVSDFQRSLPRPSPRRARSTSSSATTPM